jgi:hypothetical protein
MVTALFPVELIVTFCPALVVPVFCGPKVNDDGESVRVRVAGWPAPDRVTACGLPAPLLVTVNAPLRAPPTVGLKATVAVHEAPEFSTAGQVFPVIVKSPEFAPPRAMEEIDTAAVPVEVTVTPCPALVDPTIVVAKVSAVGDRLKDLVSTWPTPDSPTDWGLPAPLLVTVNAPLRAPPAVGANATVTKQEAAGFNVAGHVLPVIVKSPAFAPVRARLEMLTAVLPVEVTVTVCPVLVEPTLVVGNVSDEGDKLRERFELPVPVRVTDCGLPSASLVTTRAPFLIPEAVGAKATVAVHADPALSEAGQLFPVIVKSPGFEPPSAIEEIATATLPVEVMLTDCAGLVVPVFWTPKVRDEGDRVRVPNPVWLVPDKAIDCGLPVPSLVTVRFALFAPRVVGAKATDTVHEVLGLRAAGQLLPVIVKSPALAPVKEIEDRVTAPVPLEVIVTFLAVLVVPIIWLPNASADGASMRDLFAGTRTSWLIEKFSAVPSPSCMVPLSPRLKRRTLPGTLIETGTSTVWPTAIFPAEYGKAGPASVSVPEPASRCRGIPDTVTPMAGPVPMLVSCSVAE